jgi:hypothetical protein
MESGSPQPPLPRSYDDAAVFKLDPLHDAFLARELEERRFSKIQEGEWLARIANDVWSNERAVRTYFPLLSTALHSNRRLSLFFF